MVEDNKEILKKGNAAIAKGDNEGFLKYCTEDTKWTFVGEQVLHGKEAVRQWMASAYTKPPKFDVRNLIAENDFVTALGYITITDDDGMENQYAYCDVWRFREGKMAELLAFVIKSEETENN